MKGETSMGNQGTDQLPSLNLVLPDDIQQKILENVVASSGTDLFKCKTLCRSFRRLGQLDDMYKLMNIDQIILLAGTEREAVLQRCRELKNPNIMFSDGMTNFFHKSEEAAGKELIKEASTLGHRDAKFVLGMLLMAEGGKERKQAAMNLLNAEYRSSGRTWDLRITSHRVCQILDSGGRIRCTFPFHHGVYANCTMHRVTTSKLRRGFTNSAKWLTGCEVCLWDACFLRFASSLIRSSLRD